MSPGDRAQGLARLTGTSIAMCTPCRMIVKASTGNNAAFTVSAPSGDLVPYLGTAQAPRGWASSVPSWPAPICRTLKTQVPTTVTARLTARA